MSKRVVSCERCGSKIVENPHRRDRPYQFVRRPENGEEEVDEARLCSMCLDDIWEYVFDEEIDRADKVDPLPLDRLSGSVERHIEDLEDVLADLESHTEETDE